MKKVGLSISVFAVTVLILLSVLLVPIIANYSKTAKNTFLLGRDYSNLTRDQVLARLDNDFVMPAALTLKSDDKVFSISTSSISAGIDKNRIASTLLYRRLNQGIPAYIKYFFAPKNFNLEPVYDKSALDQIVTDISSQTDRPFIPAELDLENGQISYKNGQPGLSLDQANLKSAVYQSISNWNVNDVINLRIQAVGVLPDNNQVNSAKSRAQKLIGKSMVLENEISNVTVDDKTLIGWLDFNNGYSEDKIQNYIVNLAPSLKRDPVNAEFNFENGVVTQFRPAQTGLAVDGVALLETLKQKLPLLENGADKTLSYKIPVRSTDPLVKTEDVNNLGIKELLGRGTSTFHHSNETRNFNVQKGASIVNRILVAPGETFSFLKNLGDVSVDSGYKQAYIIRQGHTELDAGGGICQVSTTLFRAMLNAGLNVTSRQNHAYRVSYYEEDMPPGYDATVFIPAPDLKFINDTGHYVLIQNSYDGKNRSLTYEIYGTSDGRKVEISNYRQWGASPPPPDIYIDDPTLAPGQVVQDEHRIPGLKTSFDWKVTRNGQVINQKTFTSVYTPWAAVFRRGPQL